MIISSSDKKPFDIINENLKYIRNEIADAASKAGRSCDDIRLMAVTKTVSVDAINYAIENCGIDLIGENKVQEFLLKRDSLSLDGVEKHLIGHLQTNKIKKILGEVDVIQSVDSLHLAQAISAEAVKKGITANILLELNIGEEDSKTGFDKVAFFESLQQIAELPSVCVQGMMTIPPICENTLQLEKYFATMQEYFEDIKTKNYNNFDFKVLSMGMSGDYKQAIIHGSNLVRIGSAIFGARIYK